jgi:kynurenine formamidase
VVDLTHALTPQEPIWPGDPPVEMMAWASIERHGYALRRVCLGEHSGTHLGVAAHLSAQGRSVEGLPADLLIRPASVMDVRAAVACSADATLSVEDIHEWEARYGRTPAGAVVLLCTGWDQRWDDPMAYLNCDGAGRMHFPGYSAGAVAFLVEERQAAGLGIDSAGIDPGWDDGLAANRTLLQGDRFHLENLTHLEALPATGAVLFIGALPIAGAGGAPARVLAWLPR